MADMLWTSQKMQVRVSESRFESSDWFIDLVACDLPFLLWLELGDLNFTVLSLILHNHNHGNRYLIMFSIWLIIAFDIKINTRPPNTGQKHAVCSNYTKCGIIWFALRIHDTSHQTAPLKAQWLFESSWRNQLFRKLLQVMIHWPVTVCTKVQIFFLLLFTPEKQDHSMQAFQVLKTGSFYASISRWVITYCFDINGKICNVLICLELIKMLPKSIHQIAPFSFQNSKIFQLLRGAHPPSDTPLCAKAHNWRWRTTRSSKKCSKRIYAPASSRNFF